MLKSAWGVNMIDKSWKVSLGRSHKFHTRSVNVVVYSYVYYTYQENAHHYPIPGHKQWNLPFLNFKYLIS